MTEQYQLDRSDRLLLRALQDDARATLADLARKINLSVSQTQRRLRRLEDQGFITGYQAALDSAAVGLEVTAYVEVTLSRQNTDSAEQFHEAVQGIDAILECHRVSGDADYLLRVVAPSLKEYSSFAQTTIMDIPQVDRLRSLVVFESPKDSRRLPIPGI